MSKVGQPPRGFATVTSWTLRRLTGQGDTAGQAAFSVLHHPTIPADDESPNDGWEGASYLQRFLGASETLHCEPVDH